MSRPGALSQYVIYERPADFAEGYVVREWLVSAGQLKPGEAWTAATLHDARALIPAGAERVSGQDPYERTIIEVWM